MQTDDFYKEQIAKEGFAIINDVFSAEETDTVLRIIEETDTSGPAFRKTGDLFAIRQFLKEIPTAGHLIFTERLTTIITQLFGGGYFVVKSIYFDKPAQSNWFVAYHQDLTISVDRKVDVDGFERWTVKQNQFAVQPPVGILEDNFTIRIHLDDTDEDNGALRVIPGSHLKGIYRPEMIGREEENETICRICKGGIMVMKPLLMHSSGRTMNDNKRRVVHIEFSRQVLAGGLQWAEYLKTNLTLGSA